MPVISYILGISGTQLLTLFRSPVITLLRTRSRFEMQLVTRPEPPKIEDLDLDEEIRQVSWFAESRTNPTRSPLFGTHCMSAPTLHFLHVIHTTDHVSALSLGAD